MISCPVNPLDRRPDKPVPPGPAGIELDTQGQDRPKTGAECPELLDVKEYPDSAEVYADLAEAYQEKGDIPSAIENYRKALEKDPHDVKIQKALAQLEKRD